MPELVDLIVQRSDILYQPFHESGQLRYLLNNQANIRDWVKIARLRGGEIVALRRYGIARRPRQGHALPNWS